MIVVPDKLYIWKGTADSQATPAEIDARGRRQLALMLGASPPTYERDRQESDRPLLGSARPVSVGGSRSGWQLSSLLGIRPLVERCSVELERCAAVDIASIMTIVFAAHLDRRNALLADIFVEEGDEPCSTVEKVFPCSWAADTFLAVLGDETFAMILKHQLAEWPKTLNWPPLSSLDLTSADGMTSLAKMVTDYRRLLRSHERPAIQDEGAVYVVDRTSVSRWQFKARADDVYELLSITPQMSPEGYAFVDAGRCQPLPICVQPFVQNGELEELVTFVDSWSVRLPYYVGAAVTGVVIPHAAGTCPIARCLCELSVEERTLKRKHAY